MKKRIKKIKEIELDPQVVRIRAERAPLVFGAFAALCIMLSIPYILMGEFIGVLANYILALLFIGAIIGYRKKINHVVIVNLASFAGCVTVGVHFIVSRPYLEKGLSPYWFWLLIMPFLTMHFSGMFYGVIASLNGLVLSVLFMWGNIFEFRNGCTTRVWKIYPIIYVTMIGFALMIEYDFTKSHFKKCMLRKEIDHINKIFEKKYKDISPDYNNIEETCKECEQKMREFAEIVNEYIDEGDIDGAYEYMSYIDKALKK